VPRPQAGLDEPGFTTGPVPAAIVRPAANHER
jgi:hypothetical protein